MYLSHVISAALMPRDLTLPYSYSTGPLVAMKTSEANIPAALNLVQNPSGQIA